MTEELLRYLVSTCQPSRAPDKIEFASYRDGALIPASGADHMIWTIAIGKDHSASVIMHKDDYAELMKMVSA
ncbi:hypothetical protein ABCW43_00115 [Neorhizobium sp. IRAMC:178]|uniref:hypothetical protein n=1 Tax=Neorhizobium tunisiense TaxID=3144793 RepID=UPI0031F701B4